MSRAAAALAAGLFAACASAPERRAEPPPDRTADPDFVAAREAARPEFETQTDVLAAGVYERFVHPDSVRPAAAARSGGAAAAAPVQRAAGDPSTEELLGTLDPPITYNPPASEPRAARAPPAAPTATGPWTLQMGAYATESGAFVRIDQLARDFPDRPRWHASGGGWVRVYLGRFPDWESAERFLGEAVARGYVDAFVVRAP